MHVRHQLTDTGLRFVATYNIGPSHLRHLVSFPPYYVIYKNYKRPKEMDDVDAIPSISSGTVGSRFVSHDEIELAKSRREEQWKAAYARLHVYGFPRLPHHLNLSSLPD